MISGEAKMQKPFAREPEVVIVGLNGTVGAAGESIWLLGWGSSDGGVVDGSGVSRWGSHLGYRESRVCRVARQHFWGLEQPSVHMEVQCGQLQWHLVECCGGMGRAA